MIIYEAYCAKSGKTYIGLTTQSLRIRRQQHESYARRGSNAHLHKALRKYGNDAFEWDVTLKVSSLDEMKRLERMMISLYERQQLYNETEGGDGTFGRVASAETRKKISDNHANFKGSNHPRYGKPVSDETKRKISLALKGRKRRNCRLDPLTGIRICE